ncbi:unnamed protein product [Cylicocyclus nassatus]|uniref:Uncharacterized protein n=1 Tax=Cylicocyclus nassatus TaxID=53992 RepID=A0AA36DN16_CYLNA|nr:unnamed protein product [Cylicocyclus nassatus]
MRSRSQSHSGTPTVNDEGRYSATSTEEEGHTSASWNNTRPGPQNGAHEPGDSQAVTLRNRRTQQRKPYSPPVVITLLQWRLAVTTICIVAASPRLGNAIA